MHLTEKNIAFNSNVLITLGSSKVTGLTGRPGTGFLIKGTAAFLTSGPEFDSTRARWSWARGVVAVTMNSVTQTL